MGSASLRNWTAGIGDVCILQSSFVNYLNIFAGLGFHGFSANKATFSGVFGFLFQFQVNTGPQRVTLLRLECTTSLDCGVGSLLIRLVACSSCAGSTAALLRAGRQVAAESIPGRS